MTISKSYVIYKATSKTLPKPQFGETRITKEDNDVQDML